MLNDKYKTRAEEAMKVCMYCVRATSSTTTDWTPYWCMARRELVHMFHSCSWFIPRKGYGNAD